MRINSTLLGVIASLGLAVSGHAQLTAADDFEGYTSNPVVPLGSTGDWTGNSAKQQSEWGWFVLEYELHDRRDRKNPFPLWFG